MSVFINFRIIPVLQNKGSNLQCNNFRPISLLSNINKIYEKLMYHRMMKLLTLSYIFIKYFSCIYFILNYSLSRTQKYFEKIPLNLVI